MKLSELIPRACRDDETVKASEVARWLAVTTQTLIAWSASGRLPPRTQVGPRTWVYRVGQVREYLDRWERTYATAGAEGV